MFMYMYMCMYMYMWLTDPRSKDPRTLGLEDSSLRELNAYRFFFFCSGLGQTQLNPKLKAKVKLYKPTAEGNPKANNYMTYKGKRIVLRV